MKQQKGCEILIRGTVQGVGFRPFVYNLASRLGITGTVTNTSDGVLIRAFAEGARLDSFCDRLRLEAPPLSDITSLDRYPLTPPDDVPDSFDIEASVAGSEAKTSIPPDIAICGDCLAELHDPQDHRYHYPFINCTNCGPRFSIVESIPYDRPKTSMKVFPMCPVCNGQYNNPGDRRFHAQPNACSHCGPGLSFHDRAGNRLPCSSELAASADALAKGKVLALRGLGGFHLAVDGCSDAAVATLRKRKGRPHKPLAVMMADLETVEQNCLLTDQARQLLTSHVHPIVLLRKKKDSALSNLLAPGIDEIGVMLAYTPLHHLLLAEQSCPDILVMTSGNISGAPICTGNEDATTRLAEIADVYLLHNRDIVTRVDDSVTRPLANGYQILRRARGYVPTPLYIPWQLPSVIGCGGGLKSTFCLGRDTSIYPSQHIGDLFNLESYDFYTESVEHLKKVFQIEPELVACDLHPDYMSSHYAAEQGLPLYTIQHHHAHAVAVMAEHHLAEPVLAVIMDGTGYGTDSTIWGGEILQASLTGFTRLGHLSPLHLPGGDAAATEVWRMGISAIHAVYGHEGLTDQRLPPTLRGIDQHKRKIIGQMLANNFNSPLTSSCGRLFDAAAAIIGVRQEISYEGQAAIELESLARRAATTTWYHQTQEFSHPAEDFPLCKEGGKWEICSTEFVRLLDAALRQGTDPARAALLFHYLLVSSITELIRRLSAETGIHQVVLSGGCMQNSLLLEGLLHTLKANNLQVFTGEKMPVNDGGVSFGQTIIGGLQHVSRDSHEGYQS